MKIINFRGDLTDNSAKKEALLVSWWPYRSIGEPNKVLLIHIVGDRKLKTFSAHQQSYINACVAVAVSTRC